MPKSFPWKDILRAAVIGVPFGLTFDKTLVSHPAAVKMQMTFQKMILLKMFLAAAGGSALAISLVSIFAPSIYHKRKDALSGSSASKPYVTVVVGAAILGMGMTVGGACPGMVLSQLGSFVPGSFLVLLGGLFGAFLYAILEPHLPRTLKDKEKASYLHDRLGKSYSSVSVVLGVACLVFAVVLEWMFPWEEEARSLLPTYLHSSIGLSHGLSASAWPPAFAGALFFFFQLGLLLSMTKTLGCSSSYTFIVGFFVSDSPGRNDLAKQRNAHWQASFVISAILGGFISSTLSGSRGVAAPPSSNVAAFIGGVMMIFGARFANGCTSGHGISGFTMLSEKSFAAVPAMFGAAIALAVALSSKGVLL